MWLGGEGVNKESLFEIMSSADAKVFRKFKDQLFHRSLDECHGQCLLQKGDLALIVAKSILHYNDTAYDLNSFVIMPNHVHAIAQFRKGYDLSIIGQTWMRLSARQINRTIGSSGAFWQPEPFDHLIRSDSPFQYLRQYIASNPEKAKLHPGSFLYWNSDSEQPE